MNSYSAPKPSGRSPVDRTGLEPAGVRWFAGVFVLGLAAGLVSCSRSADSHDAPVSRPPVPVLASKATRTDVPMAIRTIGTVQAYSTVSVRSQITGPITRVHIREGQEVRRGDALFTIDPRPWQAALSQAQANLKRDEAQMLNARLQFLRTSNLFTSKIASQQDFDASEADFLAQESTVAADHEAVTNARVSLGYTQIRSAIDGRTGNLLVKEGNVVKSPDDVILVITQVQPIFIGFSVPEQNLPAIRRQMRDAPLAITATVPGDPESPAKGELTFINNLVDTNTGTIFLKGTFANANNELWPGQFVQVSMTLSNLVDATVVPSQAVQAGQNGEFVFVVGSDGTVTNQPVETSIVTGGMTVIKRGVNPGDTVVTDGQLRLVPGSRVEIRTSLESAPAAAASPGS